MARADSLPAVRRNGRPTVGSMLGDSGESGDGATVEPLLLVTHVGHDFRDRMWKAVRFRQRLVGGEAVENGGRSQMDAFTTEHAGQ